MRDRLPLSLADLIASAVTSQCRTEFTPCVTGTSERMATLACADESGLLEHRVHDTLCDQVLTFGAFVRHCAWVEHTIAHVVPLPALVPDQADSDEIDEARLRDLGRQGESRAAVESGW